MLLSPIRPDDLDDLDTPALLLDLPAFEHNVALMGADTREHNVACRPHAKAFKCPGDRPC